MGCLFILESLWGGSPTCALFEIICSRIHNHLLDFGTNRFLMKIIYFGVSYDFFADLASEQALLYFGDLILIWLYFIVSFSSFLFLVLYWTAFPTLASLFFLPLIFFLDPFGGWRVERQMAHTHTQAEAAHNRHATGPSPVHACTFGKALLFRILGIWVSGMIPGTERMVFYEACRYRLMTEWKLNP
jgi:hypothetical protein